MGELIINNLVTRQITPIRKEVIIENTMLLSKFLKLFISNRKCNISMRCVTKGSVSNKAKLTFHLLRLRFRPKFPVQGIAHTNNHCSYHKTLSSHAHMDLVKGHFCISPAFQSVEPICNNGYKTCHPKGDKWCLFSFLDKLGSLIFIRWRKSNICIGWRT